MKATEIKTLLEDVLMKHPAQETLDKVRCYVLNLCDCVAELQAWRAAWEKCIASNGERCNCSKCEPKTDPFQQSNEIGLLMRENEQLKAELDASRAECERLREYIHELEVHIEVFQKNAGGDELLKDIIQSI